MRPGRLLREDPPREADVRFLQDAIDAYNVEQTGRRDYLLVTFVLRDAAGRTVGGLVGDIWGDWLYVRVLWLDAAYRRQAHGSDLLRAAEQVAIERGCREVYLSSFSFQAPEFYEKHGYTVFGASRTSRLGT